MELIDEFSFERIARKCHGTCPIGGLFHQGYSEILKERKKGAHRRRKIQLLEKKIAVLEKEISQLNGGSK